MAKYYCLGSLLWFLCLVFVPTDEELTLHILLQYAAVTIGFILGVNSEKWRSARPWIAVMVPLIPLLLLFLIGVVLD